MKAEEYACPAESKWASLEPVWGIWETPNTRIAMLPEAARVLKPNAQLVFMTSHPISQLCCPEQPDLRNGKALLRPYLGMYELHWSDPPTVEFQLPHGKWIELLRSCGFEIEELHELGAPPEGKSKYVWADVDWAQSWPTEEVWVVKRGR